MQQSLLDKSQTPAFKFQQSLMWLLVCNVCMESVYHQHSSIFITKTEEDFSL